MATRKVTINLKVKLVLTVEEGVEISDVIDEMDYNFTPNDEHGDLVDSEIYYYGVVDSK